jgi:hypothetical protein
LRRGGGKQWALIKSLVVYAKLQAAGKFRPERKTQSEFLRSMSWHFRIVPSHFGSITTSGLHDQLRSHDIPLHSFALLVMASITRSMAFSQALRPIARQPTLLQTSRPSPLMIRRSPIFQSLRIAGLHSTTRKSAFLPALPRRYLHFRDWKSAKVV